MSKRRSTRIFSSKKLQDSLVDEIIDIARLSPSSCGLEPWQIYVYKDSQKLQELGAISNDQSQVSSCSHALIIAARTDLKSSESYMQQTISKRQKDPKKYEKVLEFFAKRFDAKSEAELYNYASMQCYIMCANLVNAAFELGVDSCIIGGFDKIKADKFLSTSNIKPALIVALGYGEGGEKPRYTRALEEIRSWR